ncbi:MAG: serine/threonine protein kinase [Candidatus Bathyarchaeota archaeon]|nr:serine/threonine protein kinase [Candidatus Bathyarchaeota archaeon]
MSSLVETEKLGENPFARLLYYPRVNRAELERRLTELKALEVSAVELAGEKRVFDVHVLGKGCVGIVVVAFRRGEKVALKIRRADASRSEMQQEAKLLEKANSVGVGAMLLGVSDNFLVMQLVEGRLLPEWLDRIRAKTRIRKVLRKVLEQCWSLDCAGLDHGELSHAHKHIIINSVDQPFIVDFETASLCRRTANVTSVCQFLFLSGSVAEKVCGSLGKANREAIIEALRRYKSEKSPSSFSNVLASCGLLDYV